MRAKDPQLPTVIRPGQITPDVTYEPPLRVGFGLNDQTVTGARATMGRTILVPGAGPNPLHKEKGPTAEEELAAEILKHQVAPEVADIVHMNAEMVADAPREGDRK